MYRSLNCNVSDLEISEVICKSKKLLTNNDYEPLVLVRDTFSKESSIILDIISKSKNVQEVLRWIYKKLILEMDKDNNVTTGVKIRIACNMLTYKIPPDLYPYCCDSLIENVFQVRKALTDEQLPFQASPASHKEQCLITMRVLRAPSRTGVTP